MKNHDLKRLFAGSDESQLLSALFHSIRRTRNDAQCAFHAAWDAMDLLSGDGFEMLLVQGNPLEDYAQAFVKIGLPQVKPIFDRVNALVPGDLWAPENQPALLNHLSGLSDELDKLLKEFFQETKNMVPVVSNYIREHRDDFADLATD